MADQEQPQQPQPQHEQDDAELAFSEDDEVEDGSEIINTESSAEDLEDDDDDSIPTEDLVAGDLEDWGDEDADGFDEDVFVDDEFEDDNEGASGTDGDGPGSSEQADYADAFNPYAATVLRKLSEGQRVRLESGALTHAGALTVRDDPVVHVGAHSTMHHHQTADAITFLPRPAPSMAAGTDPAAAAAAAACEGGAEEVLVSCNGALSVYRLEAGKPAVHIAFCKTRHRHYSIAASPCGNFVAASGATGLISLLRVERTPEQQQQQEHAGGQAPAAAAGQGQQGNGEPGADLDESPWQLVHVATLLCKNGRETMVNSVRFASFAGKLRLFAAHQDGMLYIFNVPRAAGSAAPAPAEAPAAPAEGGAAASGAAAAAHGSELMVQAAELPDWVAPTTQVNQRFAELLLALLPSQPAAAPAPAAVQQPPSEAQLVARQDALTAAVEAAARAPAAADPCERALLAELMFLQAVLDMYDMHGRVAGSSAGAISALEGLIVSADARRCDAGVFAAKAALLADIMQDAAFLQQVQASHCQPQSYRRATAAAEAKNWGAAVDALRGVAPACWVLLGASGPHAQREQQQRVAADSGGGISLQDATARAVYLLLLLRLLAPAVAPAIKQGARVLVVGYGSQQAMHARTAREQAAYPRLTTVAITGVAQDLIMAYEHQTRHEELLAERDATRELDAPDNTALRAALLCSEQAAAQGFALPANICEGSPDGNLLAVGSDQLYIVLLPAGPGYQRQACHVLHICPRLPPLHTGLDGSGSLGCQYLSFNASSTLLAASCDALRMVAVLSVAGAHVGQHIATFSLHQRGVLPVRFLPPLQLPPAAADVAVAERQGGPASQHEQQGAGAASAAADPARSALQLFAGNTRAQALSGSSRLRDSLLAYAELHGGVHLADLSEFSTASRQQQEQPGSSAAAAAPSSAAAAAAAAPAEADSLSTSGSFCLKAYWELSDAHDSEKMTQELTAAHNKRWAEHMEGLARQVRAALSSGDDDAIAEAETQVAAAEMVGVEGAGRILEMLLSGVQQRCADAVNGGASNPGASSGKIIFETKSAPRINGLALTPRGRMVAACKQQLLEWQVITRHSHEHQRRFPAALREATRLLLLASTPVAAGGGAAGSGSSVGGGGNQQLLAQLPGPVVEQVIEAAALPRIAWVPDAAPTAAELLRALRARPRAPNGGLMFEG